MRIPSDPASVPEKITAAYARCLEQVPEGAELIVRTYWQGFGSTCGLVATIGGCAMTTRLIIAVRAPGRRLWIFDPDRLAYELDEVAVIGNVEDEIAQLWGKCWAGHQSWPHRMDAIKRGAAFSA